MSWLPLFGEMGSRLGILEPLLGGYGVTLLSPLQVLHRPLRWLEAIHHARGTRTCAPELVLQAAVAAATEADIARLDLSSLDVLLPGPGPVRLETLDAFATRFAPCGLDTEALYPVGGLPEVAAQAEELAARY